MYVLGHVGLTVGGTAALDQLWRRLPPGGRLRLPGAPAIDYRVVAIGSLLPDIIDKPLGVYILRDELGNGRVFGHSLLFVLALALAAVIWRGRGSLALGLLALGSAAHLVMDRMWNEPTTLLWPFVGTSFESQDLSDWPRQAVDQLFASPYTYVSEIVGGLLLGAMIAILLARRGLREFMRSGGPSASGRGPLDRNERPQEVEGGQRPAER